MSDKLTLQLIEDLYKKNEETNALNDPSLNQINQQSISLYDQLSKQDTEEVISSDKKSGIIQGGGALLWNILDSALVGVPGIAAKKAGADISDYDLMSGKTEGIATAGAIVGQAVGFLAPMKYIGLGVRGAVSAANKLGTSRLIGDAAKQGGKLASKHDWGINREIAEKAIQKGLKEPSLKGPLGPLAKYELSLEQVSKVENQIKGSVFNSLKREFADASDEALLKITNTATDALKAKGVHINNVTRLVETGLNTKFSIDTQSKVTRYIGKAAEQGVTFGIYNLLQDGVYSLAGEKEFDPINDIKDAFIFSAFLPAIDMVGGGGRVHIYQQAKKLRKSLKKVKEKNYDDLTEGQANSLLTILTRDSYLSDANASTNIGKIAGKYSFKTQDKEKTIKAIKEIMGEVDVNTIWKTFFKDAGDDFTESLGRMILGGLYFDFNTIFDTNLIKAMSGEELISHFLVGAYFSKIKRPLFQEKYPHLNGLQERVLALEYLGLDGSSLEHYGRAFSSDMHLGATYSGILGNESVREIENIFEKDEYKSQQTENKWEGTIGDKQQIPNKDKIAIYAHELYELAAISRNLTDPRNGDSHIKLENLTPEQITEIANKVENIKISETEKLSIKNFDNWRQGVIKESLTNVGILHLEAMQDISNKIGLQSDPVDKFDIDVPFRMARLNNLENTNITDASLHELKMFNKLRTQLQEIGLVETIQTTSKEEIDINIINNAENKKFIKETVENLYDRIKRENYGENYDGDVKYDDNAFLEALYKYKLTKKQNALFNISENNIKDLTSKEKELHSILQENFGNQVPRYKDGKQIELIFGDDIDPNKKGMTESLLETQHQINLLARIWGTGKETGPLKSSNKDGKLDYQLAKDIVNQFKSQGYELNNDIVQQQKAWHYSKLLNSPNITAKHISIIDNMISHNFGELKRQEGSDKPTISIPDKNQVTVTLESYGKSRKEIDVYLQKYDDSISALKDIIGDYVEISPETDLRKSENFDTAIESMYRLTYQFDKQIYSEYTNIMSSYHGDLKKMDNIKGLLDQLYVKNPETDEIERKIVDNEQLETDLKMKIDNILADKSEFLSEKLLLDLQELRKTIIQERFDEVESQGVTRVAKLIENRLNENFNNFTGQNNYLNQMLFDMNNYSHDRIHAKRRTDEMVSRFTKLLQTKYDEIVSPNATLKDVIKIMNKKGGSAEANRLLVQHLEVWRKGYDETTFFEMQLKEQESMGDYSTQLSKKQQDVSPSTISARYERYNPNLKSSEFNTLLERYIEDDFIGISSNKNKKQLRKQIRDEVIDAIYIKHDISKDIKEDKLPIEFVKERQQFLENTYPQLILQQIGRDFIPSAKLFQNKNGTPSLEISRTIVGKGMLSEFIKEMRDIDGQGNKGDLSFDVLMLEKTGTWGGRRQDINNIKNIESIIKQSSLQSEIINQKKQLLKNQEISEKPSLTDEFQDVIRIPVSQNTTLIVGRSGLVDGRLNKRFKKWYDSKVKYLNDKKPEGYEKTLNHLKIIFGDFIKESELNSPSSRPDIKQMIRFMYFDKTSPKLFNDILLNADNSAARNEIGSNLFKYISLAESTGAKSQASEKFIKIMKEDGFVSESQINAIDDYLSRKGLNIVAVGDEQSGSPLNAQYLVRDKLKNEQNLGEVSKKQSEQIGKLLKSLDSSTLNAQSYLGTTAASLIYMHKGRKIDDPNSSFGTAGVKPTAWFNNNGESVLLKTNFVYDPKIAEVLDKSGIDILTNQSAAKAFNREYVEISKNEFDGLENKDALNIARLAANKKGPRNVAEIGLENLFLGKVEDRKKLTNITYGLADFLSKDGYTSFLNDFVNYETKINNHLGQMRNLAIGSGDRMATMQHLFNQRKIENTLFEESSDGLANEYSKTGVDPNSILLNETLKRMSVSSLMNSLRKPKTDGASYSILIPYLEGTIPIYNNIDDPKNRRQIIAGGKKLAWDDGQSKVTDVRKLQYIVTINQPSKDSPDRIKRDIQLGRDKLNKWVIEDPYNYVTEKDIKTEINKILEYEEKLFNNRTLENIHNELDFFNKSKESSDLDSKLYLHSLSLRMPNLGGDVAIHKVEGFYRKEQGNVVGVNVFDIAQIHQADFDVDAMFSYHIKPTEISNELWKFSGHSLDAYIFPSEGFSMDIFGFGDQMGKAGRAFTDGDNLDYHVNAYNQSKMNFGVAKKLTTQLSAFIREPNLINMEGIGIPKGREQVSHFLQGYKNTLQSIIDATKKPNWASEAKSQEITNYILFGDKPKGYNIDGLEKDFAMDKFNGFFNLSNINEGQRKVMKDGIIEMINTLSKSQRILTDVFDSAGRRPPDANELGIVKAELDKFYKTPNKFIYDKLNYKYRGDADSITKLNRLFYNKDLNSLEDWKKIKFENPTEIIFNIDKNNIEKLKDNTVSSYIISRFSQNKTNLQGYSDRTNINGSKARESANQILERIDIATSLGGSDTNESIREQLENNNVINGTFLQQHLKKYKSADVIKESDIRDYSLMFTALEKDKKSLQRFIEKNGKHSIESTGRAMRKLNHIEGLMDYLSSIEANLMERIGTNKSLKDRYNWQSRNIIKRNGRIFGNNQSSPTYVYRKLEKNGRPYFKYIDFIIPNGSKQFTKGEYFLLKNPIRYSSMSKSEFLDAYSMLSVTGDIQIQHLNFQNENTENIFIQDFDILKSTLGRMASETFKENKNNPDYKENWLLSRLQEDAIMKEFMDKYLSRIDSEKRNDLDFTETPLSDLTRYMLKPEPLAGNFVLQNNENIKLPMFKINKRFTNAISRYLLNNNHKELFDGIFGTYGREYRRRLDNVLPEETARLFQSKLYHKDESYFKEDDDPYLELVHDKGALYGIDAVPAMQNHYRYKLARVADISKAKYDLDGNLHYILKHGTYQKVISDMEYYKDPKNFNEKDNPNERDCP